MSNGKIINFELLYTTTNKDLLELTAEQVKSEIKNSQCESIIGLMLIDGFLYKNNESYYSVLKDIQDYAFSNGVKKLILVVGMCSDYQDELDKRNLQYEIIFWDFYVNMIYQSYKDSNTAQWNSQADKFLFLGGVPSRPNRIVLLSKIYSRGLLKNSEWSFFPPWTVDDQEWCRNALSDMEDYDKFLLDCKNSIDDLYETSKNYSRYNSEQLVQNKTHETAWCQSPGWVNPTVFERTLFSLLSEGNAYPPATDYKFLTEKTWRAVANKHPFIFAGEVDQFNFLKSRGLRTFENYTDSYPYIENEDNRLDAVTDATEQFLKNIKLHQEEIAQDVEYNYQIYLKEVSKNQSILENIQNQYSIEQSEIDKWFHQKSFIHLAKVVQYESQ
jgi:hypothetical protein